MPRSNNYRKFKRKNVMSTPFSALSDIKTKIRVYFGRSCLKQEKLTFNHKSVGNIYVV